MQFLYEKDNSLVSLDPKSIFCERFKRAPDLVKISDGKRDFNPDYLKLMKGETPEDIEWLMSILDRVLSKDGIYMDFRRGSIVRFGILDFSSPDGKACLFSENIIMETTLLRILTYFLCEALRDARKMIVQRTIVDGVFGHIPKNDIITIENTLLLKPKYRMEGEVDTATWLLRKIKTEKAF